MTVKTMAFKIYSTFLTAKNENNEYELDALKLVAKLAEGGMRDALSILEQCLAYNDKLSIDSVNKVYGLLSMDNKIIFIKKLINVLFLARNNFTFLNNNAFWNHKHFFIFFC